jgi:hypothetical protein
MFGETQTALPFTKKFMPRIFTLSLLGLNLIFLLCSEAASNAVQGDNSKTSIEQQAPKKEKLATLNSSSFKTIDWDNLMPEDDLNALLNPPSYIDELEDSPLEDVTNEQLQIDLTAAVDDRYQQALVSTKIIKEMDGQAVRIPGFVVPVEFDEETITEFYLVPYFGACIHSPPPPPNQIIYVHAPDGLKLNTLYDPFWISGIISTTLVENYMATSAYSMKMKSYKPYTE